MIYYDLTVTKNWSGNPTGIARVVENLHLEIQKQKPCTGFYFCNTNKKFLSIGTDELIKPIRSDVIILPGKGWDFPNFNACLAKIKEETAVKVTTLIYDLIPIKLPYSFGPGFLPVYQQWLDETIIISDNILAISQSTLNDFTEYNLKFHKKEELQGEVIRLSEDIGSTKATSIGLPEEIKESKFALSVGSLEIRKNHILLLNLWEKLFDLLPKEDIPKLVLVGREGWLNGNLIHLSKNNPKLKDNVFIITDADDSKVKWLYTNSMFTLYPSLYEGWGLPIAEALAYGKISINADTSSMVEVAPNLTINVSPNNLKAWVNTVIDLISNNSRRKELEVKIVENYKTTTWQDVAKDILNKV